MKKAISLLLALMLCVGLAAPALAAETSGKCGDNVIWSYSNGTLTFSGTGPVYDYGNGYAPWHAQREAITSVVIENGVTSIGKYAFYGYSSLISVTIPDSVTTIGERAFGDCTSLTAVTIPNSVTTIGAVAFDGTPWLKSLGEFAIANGILLKYQGNGGSVIIPSSVTSIGAWAFQYCDSPISVTIPNIVTTIGEYAFRRCYNLTSVTIPGSVTTIEEGTFHSCDSLTSVTIPSSVTTIGDRAFEYCSSLTSVTIQGNVTSIGERAFDGCSSLTSVTIPNSVTTIGKGAFFCCSSLTSVTIPGSVATIEEGVFYSCSGLTSLTISKGVTTIDRSAFEACTSLTSVTIPDSVTGIYAYAFSGCNSLTDVYYGGSESQWKQIEIVNDNDPLLNATIHYNSAVPSSSAPTVTVTGVTVKWTDAKPFIDANDRTMVPLRAVADAMGLDVNWDENTREASFTGSSKTITFPIDRSTARTSDGGTVKMDTAAVIVNNRTYAPIRYLAEYFGYTVGWDAATRTVTITG